MRISGWSSDVCSSDLNPRCPLCPLSDQCMAFAAGDPAQFPVKPLKSARPQRTGNAYWIEREGRVWLVTRPSRGMLGAMSSEERGVGRECGRTCRTRGSPCHKKKKKYNKYTIET